MLKNLDVSITKIALCDYINPKTFVEEIMFITISNKNKNITFK